VYTTDWELEAGTDGTRDGCFFTGGFAGFSTGFAAAFATALATTLGSCGSRLGSEREGGGDKKGVDRGE